MFSLLNLRILFAVFIVLQVIFPENVLSHTDTNWISMIDWIGLPSPTAPDSERPANPPHGGNFSCYGPGGDVTYWTTDGGTVNELYWIEKCKSGYMNMSFLSNYEASGISSFILNIYMDAIGSPPQGRIYAYAVDNNSIQTTTYIPVTVIPGWNRIDVTNLLPSMSGFGFIKFRLVQEGQGDISLYEAYYSVIPVGGGTNDPPAAVINGPYTSVENQTVSFNSAGSADPNGDTLKYYYWNFGNGSYSILPNPIESFEAGNYTVTLTVTDEHGLTSEIASTTLTVIPDNTVNQAPVANAGPDRAVQVRATTNFDGSSSFDPDGAVQSFSWNFGDGKSATGMTTTHSYTKAGTYTVTLTVTDDKGATASDTVIVSVVSGTVTKGAISGNVTENVTPFARISSANVSITDASGQNLSVLTDVSGSFSFADVPIGSFNGTVTKTGYLGQGISGTVSAGQITFISVGLPSIYGTLRGTVTDSTSGLEISGVSVIVTDSAGTVHTATTDASGVYIMSQMAAGAFTGLASKTGYLSRTISGSISSGQTTNLNFFLFPYGRIAGTVTDSGTSAPISSATVSITDTSGRSFNVTTDTNGSFSFDNVAAGAFSGSVSKANYITKNISGTVTAGQTTTLNIGLAQDGRITGIVTDSVSGVPISNANINVTDSMGTPHWGTSNGAGAYTLTEVAPGLFTGRVDRIGFSAADISGNVPSGQTVNVNATLVPLSGIVRGTVTDSVTGSPIPAAQVSVTDNTSVVHSDLTDPWGVYTIPVNNPGTFTGTVMAANYIVKNISGTVIIPQTTVVDVQLRPFKGTISGIVTDAGNGLPVEGAAISVTDIYGRPGVAWTDNNGMYQIGDLGEGAITGTVSKAGYSTANISGNVVGGQTTNLNVSLIPILPVISNLQVTDISSTSVTVTWTTDQLTDSRVDFGTTTAYGGTVSDASRVASHSLNLTGLSPGTTYHFRVVSSNEYGIATTSADNTFRTLLALRDLGGTDNVAVIELSGNYDATFPNGSINDLPRRDVAAMYFATRGDVDFLVTLSTFDYTMPEAGAQGFYLEVQNSTQGIGKPTFNNAALFGSAGKLQGIIEAGNVTSLAAAPNGVNIDETLKVLNHELLHRFGAYVRYRKPDSTLSTDLLGRDVTHWSYLLDTKGSLLYGNGWHDNGGGTFTSTAGMSVYSPLDLYLMGMIPKEKVPPMLLIDNTAIDATQLPQLSAVASGTAKSITIDDIIAAEGERIPGAAGSQKQFTVGFVLLVRPGDSTTQTLQAIELLRKAWRSARIS
jgi:PKD repeat protein